MPIDPTPPSAGIMTQTPEDKKLPQPEEAGNGQPETEPNPRDTDMRGRPQLPTDTEVTAADIEDEEADPVVDTGPGIADGPDTRH